jgi:TatD DNase family protein
MPLEFFDSHVHETLFMGESAAKWRDRTASAVALGVRGMLVPSAESADWERLPGDVAQVAQSTGLEFAGFALGLHPWWVAADEASDEALAQQLSRAVDRARAGGAPLWAIGECGIDAGKRYAPRSRQLAWVARHVALARRHDLPLILHAVGAQGTLLDLLDELQAPPSILHGFTGAPEMALAYVRRGHRLGFGRALLDPRAKRVRASASAVPERALLIETDTPPRTMADDDTATNVPELPDVARALATLRGTTIEHVAATTWANATSVFRLGGHT